MRGYSGSGKSTRAAEIAKGIGAVVVNRDSLRFMLLGSYWTGKREDEDRVTVAEEAQVEAFLRNGTSVVVDATHLHAPYLRKWARLATRLGVDFGVVDVVTPLDECKRHDYSRMLKGDRYVGDKVIDQQAKKWPVEKWPLVTAEPFVIEPVEWIPGLPEAIIVDIDGTLAHMTGRSPYDYSRVGEDAPDLAIAELVRVVGEYVSILIVSGRDDDCRDVTADWLEANLIGGYDELHMRPTKAVDDRGNKLPDYQVKYDLFNQHIRGKYNVRFVLDDRTQVVEMWRALGLKTLQVEPGDF
ncbi:AAA family ATPase [Mycobacterium sp. IS-836]|uniref:phosphatase domain-containing protein n=1 Tax=Mycobacterium sp. IS-836 TaxID=1834160 RepID=UPI0018E9D53E|nr:AAA family ATPase [Mycobacterium sp. IS-836]